MAFQCTIFSCLIILCTGLDDVSVYLDVSVYFGVVNIICIVFHRTDWLTQCPLLKKKRKKDHGFCFLYSIYFGTPTIVALRTYWISIKVYINVKRVRNEYSKIKVKSNKLHWVVQDWLECSFTVLLSDTKTNKIQKNVEIGH